MTSTYTSTEPTERTMSRRERCAWINLSTTLVVYVPYFLYFARLLGRGGFHGSDLIGPFLVAVAAQIVLSIIAVCVFALPARSEPKDERDVALEGRSLRVAYYVLASSGFSLVLLVPVFLGRSLIARGDVMFVLLMATQLFLFCFVVAEATRFALLALGYRRGF